MTVAVIKLVIDKFLKQTFSDEKKAKRNAKRELIFTKIFTCCTHV